jgi:hypothetical protein
MTTPSIKPIKIPELESKQSKYKFSGSLPTRSLILAPSGGGKTVLLQNMILDISTRTASVASTSSARA